VRLVEDRQHAALVRWVLVEDVDVAADQFGGIEAGKVGLQVGLGLLHEPRQGRVHVGDVHPRVGDHHIGPQHRERRDLHDVGSIRPSTEPVHRTPPDPTALNRGGDVERRVSFVGPP